MLLIYRTKAGYAWKRILSLDFEKCFVVGMSCGGMQGVYFAVKYPQYIAAFYLDAHALNLLSWPLGLGESKYPSPEEFGRDMGLSVSEMLNF